MAFTNSSLVSYTKLSPNHSGQRNHAIDTITIHCVVGQCSVQTLGAVFAPESRQASSNYGVGYDGKIGMYCEEKNRSWCSSSAANDHRAITIEVASDTTHPYAVNAKAYAATLDLVTDICKRNGIKKLVWSTNKNDRVNHLNGCNLTVHRDFANKSCPGDYLYERHDEIVAEVNKRLNAGTSTTATTTSGKTYTVVTKINKYSTADDAKNKTNSKGTMGAGTYYIYNKYPSGYNGMYNVSTDKTGASAGSWINPAENVIKQETTPTTDTQKLYRVRKSKDDAKSQVGAYSVLANAKSACDKAGVGYKVFDWDYKIVYEYTAPAETKPVEPQPQPTEKPKEEPKVTAVYDLDYPEKNLIVDKSVSRTQTDCVKAIKKILSNNADFDIEIAKAFWKLAPKYNIDPMMAIAQSILETGWFKYAGSAVKPEQHNYCGLGVTSNGVEGGKFDTIEDGVTAQLQHLFAYGSKDALDETIIDPRFKYVTRGIAPYWQQLAGRWACPGYDASAYDTPEKAMKAGNTYGQKIRTLYNQIAGTTVTDDDIKKYFPKDEPKPTDPPVDDTDDKPTDTSKDTVDTPTYDEKTSKIADIIIDVLKKLLESLLDIFRKGTK